MASKKFVWFAATVGVLVTVMGLNLLKSRSVTGNVVAESGSDNMALLLVFFVIAIIISGLVYLVLMYSER